MIAARSGLPIALVVVALATMGVRVAHREVDPRVREIRTELEAAVAAHQAMLLQIDRLELEDAQRRVLVANDELERVIQWIDRAKRVHIDPACMENPLLCK